MSKITDSQLTFSGLISHFSRVEIPIIQRDYAQGRKTAEDVRNGLLEAFKTALEKEPSDPSLPLDLDFIYGNITQSSDDDERVFSPLDGQQRLTTLFLLHWFTAWKDGAGELFKEKFCAFGKSKFTYLVRPSSEEFFDALAAYVTEGVEDDSTVVSELIQEQPWFFLSWKLDPTIQSALRMLDTIQQYFADTHGLFAKLMDEAHPVITFQFLELEQFGLSDDLYIKMNARGKPLTVFENFKARLEKHLEISFPHWRESLKGKDVSVKEYFSRNIETTWADLFWNYRDEESHLFDAQVMSLFRDIISITRNPSDSEKYDSLWLDLRNLKEPLTFQRCAKLKCLDEYGLKTWFTLMDQLSGEDSKIRHYLPDVAHFDEDEIFKKAIDPNTSSKYKLNYEELILLHAYSGYLLRHDSIDPEKIEAWMRVISNLARNTVYNRTDDFRRSIRALNGLFDHADTILDYFKGVDLDKMSGFNEQQVREEKLKAQLILSSSEWAKLVMEAEGHGYFAGQIEFIFKFSGILDAWTPTQLYDFDVSQDEIYRAAFLNYFKKADSIFKASGLRTFKGNLWERALLAEGDYLIPSGRQNYSFLKNDGREISWKRLLRGNPKKPLEDEKRNIVKLLLDRLSLDENPEDELKVIVENTVGIEDEWKRLIIQEPRHIAYCDKRGGSKHKRLICRRFENRVYLLETTRVYGLHAELFSYDMYLNQIQSWLETADSAPYTEVEYHSRVGVEDEPYIALSAVSGNPCGEIYIFNTPDDNANFKMILEWEHAGNLDDSILQIFEKAGFSKNEEEQMTTRSKEVHRDNVLTELKNLVKSIRLLS